MKIGSYWKNRAHRTVCQVVAEGRMRQVWPRPPGEQQGSEASYPIQSEVLGGLYSEIPIPHVGTVWVQNGAKYTVSICEPGASDLVHAKRYSCSQGGLEMVSYHMHQFMHEFDPVREAEHEFKPGAYWRSRTDKAIAVISEDGVHAEIVRESTVDYNPMWWKLLPDGMRASWEQVPTPIAGELWKGERSAVRIVEVSVNDTVMYRHAGLSGESYAGTEVYWMSLRAFMSRYDRMQDAEPVTEAAKKRGRPPMKKSPPVESVPRERIIDGVPFSSLLEIFSARMQERPHKAPMPDDGWYETYIAAAPHLAIRVGGPPEAVWAGYILTPAQRAIVSHHWSTSLRDQIERRARSETGLTIMVDQDIDGD